MMIFALSVFFFLVDQEILIDSKLIKIYFLLFDLRLNLKGFPMLAVFFSTRHITRVNTEHNNQPELMVDNDLCI